MLPPDTWKHPFVKSYGGGMDWDFGINRCKLLYIEWIDHKVLLCSLGNYIQYPRIKPKGKEYEKECICMINKSLCCAAVTNIIIQLYFMKIKFLKRASNLEENKGNVICVGFLTI